MNVSEDASAEDSSFTLSIFDTAKMCAASCIDTDHVLRKSAFCSCVLPRFAALIAAGLVQPDRLDAAYLCGPDSMMMSCRAALEAAGVAPGRIATEHFTPATPASGIAKRTPSAPRKAAQERIEGSVEVRLRADGVTRQLSMDPARQTVLSAGQAAGLELPYSCEAGMCCTCRCRLVEGAVEMDANYSLEPWEMEAGFILSCQARPTTKSVTVDFDAV